MKKIILAIVLVLSIVGIYSFYSNRGDLTV